MLKILISQLVFILIFAVAASAQDSISISDFRYPETRAIDLKGGMTGSFNNSIDHFYDNGPGNEPITSGSHNANGNIDANAAFLLFHVNDRHTFDLKTSATFQYSKLSQSEASSSMNSSSSSTSAEDNKIANVSVACSYLRYLDGDGPHVFGSYNLAYAYSYSQYGYSPPNRQANSYRNVSFNDEGILGVGYGRIRDGTFVFQAERIVERLREDGAIKNPLSHAQMVSLIDRIAHSREYTTNYERSEKYLVRDIVGELASSGAIDSSFITAYSSLRVAEGLRELIDPRFFGWRVAYGFGVHGNVNRNTSYQGAAKEISDFSTGDDYLHQLSAEFGQPLSLYTHLHTVLTFVFPRFRANLFSTVNFVTTLTHQVGERFDVQLGYSFLKGQSSTVGIDYPDYDREFTHTISGSFVYFVEDQVRFTTTLNYTGSERPSTVSYLTRSSTLSISFSMLYNII